MFWPPFSHDKKLYLLKERGLCDFWQILYFNAFISQSSWKCTLLTDYPNHWLSNKLKYTSTHKLTHRKNYITSYFSLLQQIDEISVLIDGPKFSCTSFGVHSFYFRQIYPPNFVWFMVLLIFTVFFNVKGTWEKSKFVGKYIYTHQYLISIMEHLLCQAVL